MLQRAVVWLVNLYAEDYKVVGTDNESIRAFVREYGKGIHVSGNPVRRVIENVPREGSEEVEVLRVSEEMR